ncbi:Outer membrane protein TolC [Desulfacinum hydrothermale DSM 13146]|uniref:Outer membrane protein TolC n=1 Tax=Desulfacinum hydrothermale DSM 13146 TaxID=1121390 RepID=A0A1W1XVR6_9BACT|nr:TolC family protein [Desulfacinum hydrothermale]SMC27924.1 Outer membrane protein TolC [Desulfacinum hydrothermale DSM 13146]
MARFSWFGCLVFVLILTGPLPCTGGEPPGSQGRAVPRDHGPWPVWTLERAVATALEHHPRLRATAAGRKAAQAGLREARSGYLPTVGLSQKVVRSNHPVFVFGSLLEQGRFGPANFDPGFLNDPDPLTNIRSEATVRWTLFDQWQTPARVSEAEAGKARAALLDRWARQRVRYGVIRTFYGVQVADARVRVARQAVRSAQAQVRRIRDLFENGQVVRSHLLAAQVLLADFRQRLIQVEGDAETARRAFLTALGRTDAAGAVRVQGELPAGPFPMGALEEVMEEAIRVRPDLEALRRQVDAAQARLRAARGFYLPRLDAFSTYGMSGDEPSRGSSDYTVGVALSWDLFQGRRAPAVERARADLEMVRARLQEAEDQVGLEVTRAWQALASAEKRLDVAQRAARQAEEALRIVEDRYGAGLTTITELLRAQTAQLQARLQALEARYAYVTGYAAVLVTSGRLDDLSVFMRP